MLHYHSSLTMVDFALTHDVSQGGRALRLFRAINDAFEDVTDETTLLQKICEVVVQVGNHELAWIGVAEQDEGRSVRVAAHAGLDNSYVRELHVTWSDTEAGRGPVGTAIRTGQPKHTRTSSDPCFAPWKNAALARGFAVCLAIPLMVRGKVFGALAIYARNVDTFDDPVEVSLLAELARIAGREWALLAADRARQEAEARFNEIAEHVRDIFWSIDAHTGQTEYSSPAFTTITGFPREVAYGGIQRILDELVHPEDRPLVAQHLVGTARSDHAELEFRAVRADGQTRWLRVRMFLQRDPRGRPRRMVGTIADVTEQHHASEALQRNEQRFRWVIENGWDVVLLTDATGLVAYASQAWQRVLGWSPNELVGTRAEQVAVPGPSFYDEHFMASSLAQPGVPVRFEMPARHRDGRLVWFEVTALNLLTNPSVSAIVWTGRDITERREHAATLLQVNAELERRVAERTAELTDLYDNAPCGYNTLSPEGFFTQTNATMLRWLGFTREELVDKLHVTQLLTPEACEMFVREFPRILHDGAVDNVEAQFQRKDGNILHALVNAVAVRDTEGRFTGVRATVFDNTERHAMELRVREANTALEQTARAKDEFLASMSHELRTPLNGMLGMTEALREEVYGPLNERQDASLGRIHESGKHLLALINDILDLAKIEAGKVEIELTPVSITELCRRSLEIVQVNARRKGLTVSYKVSVSTHPILVDERRMKQVLVNLLGNAVKFTPTGGRIGLNASIAGDSVCFEVWDTGVGIAAEDQPRLFRPFEQLNSRLSREHAGTGLGLSLVRGLVTLHRGEIRVESTPGTGSRFTVTLPLVRTPTPAQRPTATQTVTSPSEVHNTRPPRILLTEDDETTASTTSDFLQMRGYEVHIAHNGIEALRQARELHPDLILMDVQMPGMDGLEATRTLRADPSPAIQRIPIVALTALAMPGDRERCLAAGANEHLTKPVGLKHLLTVIERMRTS